MRNAGHMGNCPAKILCDGSMGDAPFLLYNYCAFLGIVVSWYQYQKMTNYSKKGDALEMNAVVFNFEGVTTLDETGRLVIPAPVRKHLGIAAGEKVRLSVKAGELVIRPYVQVCEHCGGEIEQNDILLKLRICRNCMNEMKKIV